MLVIWVVFSDDTFVSIKNGFAADVRIVREGQWYYMKFYQYYSECMLTEEAVVTPLVQCI